MANSPSNFATVNPDSATLVIDDDDRKFELYLTLNFSHTIYYEIIKTTTVLELQLQQAQYQVFESNDQDICYEVVSGVLSFDINQAVSLTTADGSAMGKLKNSFQKLCAQCQFPYSQLQTITLQ